MTYLEAQQIISKASKLTYNQCESVQTNNHGGENVDINLRGSFVVILDDFVTECYVKAITWIENQNAL